jgi:protein SCO1/2
VPEIALTGQDGQPFTLSSLRGQVVALFFGFTTCPDECPVTLAVLDQSKALLGEDAAGFQVVFVTTDPGRDTPTAIASFLSVFDPSFVGLTGSPEALQQTWDDYGVTVMDNGETHSTTIYLIDAAGDLRVTYPINIDPADLAADIRALMQEK